MDKLLAQFLRKAKSNHRVINAIQIHQKGALVVDFNRFNDKERFHSFSASKSVTAIGVGIAIDEGLLTLDEKIADSFAEYIPANADGKVYDITVEHLLKMSCGLKEPLFFFSTPERYQIKDWIAHFFAAEFEHQPGTHFLYSNFNAYMLSCLIEKKCGVNLCAYLEDRLFSPLGIYSPDWFRCPMGHTTGANGLFLTIDEMASFGQLLINQGSYHGTQLVSQGFMAAATQNQYEEHGPEHGYGYQIWRSNDEQSYHVSGKYGQLIYVLEAEETVVSVQSLDEQDIESFLWDELILPLKAYVNSEN
ncbi:serine hydrolase [Vagococcus sp. BWB3-3]|uniref:Serine hydrolase n=1 Tax=Vagococcus allomyrinae TaxID=2794353 RepID=A0A940SUC2_9ENTE|nr:serine hydrolase [Vagococcus allomyrinae]MBP1039926.1 serine hydrolase [Vagococcus allomyrinae]